MNNDVPGVCNTPFKITMVSRDFRKGDVIKASGEQQLIVLSEPQHVLSWWRRLILRLFGGRDKLRAFLSTGYTYTVKLKHAD